MAVVVNSSGLQSPNVAEKARQSDHNDQRGSNENARFNGSSDCQKDGWRASHF